MAETTIAAALEAELRRRELTQAQAARALGILPNRLGRWLQGDEPTPDCYGRLQKFLSIDRAELGLLLLATKEKAWSSRRRAPAR
jgi:transcriptional regulator with XRE-family HTH domain